MFDSDNKRRKEQQKQRVKKRYNVTIDPENYLFIPAKKQTDYYDDDVHQRVAIYVRVSTDDVRQTTSYELQKKYYEEAIGYNTATRDAYLEQFKLGERSLLDVLDAESELFNSSTQYTTANGNVVVGAYRLYALTGMLLPELGIKEDPLYESPRNQQEKR